MNNWFTVKVKYTKQLEDGGFKRVSEPYLLAAMTFTDAEARIYEELGSIIRGEFVVNGISRTEINDIFSYDDSDIWYKCKVTYENFDADSEKGKKVSQNFLVSADSVKQAYERITESLKDMLVDISIPSIILSPIVEIFPYNEELDKEIGRRPLEKTDVVDEETGQVTSSEENADSDTDDEDENSGVVFSASGSDAEDEDEDEIES
ncbi:MAG: DUF4494 domain-containing protein [Fluviicola sp.]|nr:DUF4494 domain-containing protein [Fluviicola sp.]